MLYTLFVFFELPVRGSVEQNESEMRREEERKNEMSEKRRDEKRRKERRREDHNTSNSPLNAVYTLSSAVTYGIVTVSL